MTINFADGIEIVVDDEKLLNWEQSKAKKTITLNVQEGSGFARYEVDLKEKQIHRG